MRFEELSVQIGRQEQERVQLDGVSFPVAEKSLLAVVGPSGAGKSTLLNTLTGMRPADQGSVRYDGRDLYRDYAELRQRIGLVPQDDTLHTQLTVRRALSYAAELRFPGDTERAERARRVEAAVGAAVPTEIVPCHVDFSPSELTTNGQVLGMILGEGQITFNVSMDCTKAMNRGTLTYAIFFTGTSNPPATRT